MTIGVRAVEMVPDERNPLEWVRIRRLELERLEEVSRMAERIELRTRPGSSIGTLTVNADLRRALGLQPLPTGCSHPANKLRIQPPVDLSTTVVCLECGKTWKDR